MLAQTSDFLPFHILRLHRISATLSALDRSFRLVIIVTSAVVRSPVPSLKFTKMGRAMRAKAQDAI